MSEAGHTTRIPLETRVLEVNDTIAAANRAELARRGIFSVDIIGAPGSGKTALLEATLRALAARPHAADRPHPADRREAAVLVGDLTTRRDADRLSRWCDKVVQISTGQGCHLEANQVRDAMAGLDLETVDLLFIENVGNLICPVGFDLGQNAKVGVFSLTEGDDKAAKHPYLVEAADVILLNKIDLLPHLTFDLEVFHADVRLLNPNVPVLEVSATTGQGFGEWLAWLEREFAGNAGARAG